MASEAITSLRQWRLLCTPGVHNPMYRGVYRQGSKGMPYEAERDTRVKKKTRLSAVVHCRAERIQVQWI